MTPDSLWRSSRDARFRSELQGRALTVAELTPRSRSVGAISLRRFPFPFRCGLAINNDSRGCSPESFQQIHATFAERELELGAAASFDPSDVCYVGSPDAHRLHDAGLLDTLTGLPAGGAVEGVQQLSRFGIRPLCHAADGSVSDAAPLAEAGVSFFTDNSFSASEKFGDAYEFKAAGHLQEAFARFDFGQFGIDRDTGSTNLVALVDTLPKEERRSFLLALFNGPIVRVQSPDGTTLNVFKRYVGPQRPAGPLLPLQLRSQFLDTLESFGGSVIIQQRLGDHALIGMTVADECRRAADGKPFGIHELVALDDLADRARDRILVTSTGRLLTWLALQRDLEFGVEQSGRWNVRIAAPSDDRQGYGAHRLEGLAFDIPSDAPETVVYVGDDRVETIRQEDPATPGYDCLFIPWKKRPWPSR